MKRLALLLALLGASPCNAETYAEYKDYYRSTSVYLTDLYMTCPGYDYPLMAVQYDESGLNATFGCYTLQGNNVVIVWDESFFLMTIPAREFTIL